MSGQAKAMQPEDVTPLVIERVNAGDAAGVAALYEPQAVLAYPADRPVTGRVAPRGWHRGDAGGVAGAAGVRVSADGRPGAGVRAAVVSPERELRSWFSWRWYWADSLVGELVRDARLRRIDGHVTAAG